MGRVIDSTLLVAAERGQVDLEALRSTEPRRIAREAFVENLLRALRVIPFDLPIARVHARLRARMPRNRQIGAHDLMIGATAVSLGYAVLSRDRRSFPRIPDLRVEVA